jgi:hypothetical protein
VLGIYGTDYCFYRAMHNISCVNRLRLTAGSHHPMLCCWTLTMSRFETRAASERQSSPWSGWSTHLSRELDAHNAAADDEHAEGRREPLVFRLQARQRSITHPRVTTCSSAERWQLVLDMMWAPQQD